MTAPSFGAPAAFASLAFAAVAPAQDPPDASAKATSVSRPSLLLITLDTTRRDFMGFLGRKPSPTPNLDAFAAKSIIFSDALTTAPLTLPAHASLLTGLYPMSHGVHDNSLYRLPDDARTLAEILRDQGFATGAAVAAFVLDPVFGLEQGFERYSAPPRGTTRARTVHFSERRAREMVDQALADLDQLAAPAGDTSPGAPPARPFFYWLHLFDPHNPYDPPNPVPMPGAIALDSMAVSRALYEAEIAQMDVEIGRLFGELDRRGLSDSLLIVVAADHGEGLGEGHETTHGHFLFDPTVRVPLLLRDPRITPARVDVPVSLIDVVPTLLARLGIEADGERFDGLDLSPWIAEPDRAAPDRALALESWYVWLQYGWAPFEGCTSGALKYVRSQHEELFDRSEDPGESQNLFAPDDARALALRRRLATMHDDAAAIAHAHPGLSDADLRALQSLGYATGGSNAELPAGDWAALPDAYLKLDVIRGFDDAAVAIDGNDFGRAIELLRGLAASEPESALFHENLGCMLVNVGTKDLTEAERELKRALELDPRRARVWFALARCAVARRDAARVEARKLRDRGDARAARAPAAREREQTAAALRALRECLRLESTYTEGLIELARLLLEEGDRAINLDERELARSLYQEVEALAGRIRASVPKDSKETIDATAAQALARTRLDALKE